MRWKANVRRITGVVKHYYAAIEDGDVVRKSEIPSPAWVEIEEAEGAFYINRFDATGEFLTNSWHQTLLEAQEEANREFCIGRDDWEIVND